MIVVFFVWPAEQLAAQIMTTLYEIPVVERIQIALSSSQRSLQGGARSSIDDSIAGTYAAADTQARQLLVFARTTTAIARETSAVMPVWQLRILVEWSVES